MQPGVAVAQATTLLEWADLWERRARMDKVSGSEEVAVLMRRAARQIRAVTSGIPAADPEPPPLATPVQELRDG